MVSQSSMSSNDSRKKKGSKDEGGTSKKAKHTHKQKGETPTGSAESHSHSSSSNPTTPLRSSPEGTAFNGRGSHPLYEEFPGEGGGFENLAVDEKERGESPPVVEFVEEQPKAKLTLEELCAILFGDEDVEERVEALQALADEEKERIAKYKAARVMQAWWKGSLTRFKLEILHQAAAKIQAHIRGFVARSKFLKVLKEKRDKELRKKMEEAAIKIQAAWRGFLSRKNKLNFKEFKKIQAKNEALKKSINTINNVESVMTTTSAFTRMGSGLDMDLFLCNSFPELENMSGQRVAEWLTYMIAEDCLGGGGISSPCRPEDPNLAKMLLDRLRIKSVADLFPEVPDKSGIIKPNPEKVEALKTAIRLLQKNTSMMQMRTLQRKHYLLRTAAVPGVYSDIYCNELTEFEKQLKSVKYWNQEGITKKKVKRIPKKLVRPVGRSAVVLYPEEAGEHGAWTTMSETESKASEPPGAK